MLISAFQKRIQTLDMYKKIPKGLAQATYSGAIISIITICIIILLFLSELKVFYNYQYHTEMIVDDSNPDKQARLNIVIYFKYCNCYVLQMVHQNNKYAQDNIVKYQTANSLFSPGPITEQLEQISNEDLMEKFKKQEGCILHYSVLNDQIPNVFKITPFNKNYSVFLFKQFELKNVQINMHHVIVDLHFGDQESHQKLTQQYIEYEKQSPLTGFTSYLEKDNNIQYEYFLNVIPAIFHDFQGQQEHFFQYTSQSQNFKTEKFPVVEIRYDFSPITMNYIQERERIYQFIVQICAIVGGIFTVAGIIDSIVHQSVIKITQKHQMGKLS